MHSRSSAGWRVFLLAAATATLILLPISSALGAPLESTVNKDNDNGGLGLALDSDEAIGRPTLHPRTTYTWPFATGPYYGNDAVQDAPGILRTHVGTFDLGRGQLSIPQELRAATRVDQIGAQYFVLQVHPDTFGNDGFASIRETIESAGGAFLKEQRVASFVVRLTAEAFASAQGLPGVIAVEPYHPAFKLSPTIGRVPLPNPYQAVSEVYDLDVMAHAGEDTAALAQTLAALGGTVLHVDTTMVRVEIHRNQLAAIAGIESVYKVWEHLPVFAKAEETTNTVQIGRYCPVDGGPCGPSPYWAAGVDGGGTWNNGTADVDAQRLMVLDTGIQIDAGDMSDTRTNAGSPSATHRKVVAYESTNQFGGGGDLLGCDASSQGRFTHGHTVSTTALGWGSDVDPGYGDGWTALDPETNKEWLLDGLAPRAKLIAYDAQVTPALVSCSDPGNDTLNVGTLFNGVGGNASLDEGYRAPFNARVSNFSWGTTNSNTYSAASLQIDQFLDARRDAMVFVSAGNEGADENFDLVPDPETISAPATCKNCLVIGATGVANDLGTGTPSNPNDADERFFFSSVGPVIGNRTAPHLMAPGGERGNMGIDSEYSCLTTDNDQNNPVQCDIVQNISGTSFSSPAAAGAALVVRDYFAKGFYPDGTDANPGNAGDQVPNISGALLKSILIASAEWVGVGNVPGQNCTRRYRFNREQGYGRIQLDEVLPLQTWGLSPIGLIVADGDLPGGGGANNTTLTGQIAPNSTETTTFTVSDPTQELHIALAWTEADGQSTINNLDLEVQAPSGAIYYGNYFTDDNNRNGSLDAGEDCPSLDGSPDALDQSPWSLKTCANSVRDNAAGAATRTFNTSEGIFLSPDPDADDNIDDGFSQTEAGDWTLRVRSGANSGTVNYAVAIAGGVSLGSSVRFDRGNYVCNSNAAVVVNEVDDPSFDPAAGLTPGEISSRVTVEVVVNGDVVDTEVGITFTKPDPNALRFVSENLVISDGLAPDPGNGALDVVDGATLRVSYQDESTEVGVDPGDLLRVSRSTLNCSTAIGFGNLVFSKFGRDAVFSIDGGCERNARGAFDFGFPDEYLDQGERVRYALAFFNDESAELIDTEVELRCVIPDVNSPPDCRPGSTDCADPNRLDNAPCTSLSIVDPVKVLGNIPSGSAIGAHFTVDVTSGAQEDIEMVLGVSSSKAGKTQKGYAVQAHTINVDEFDLFYNTDYPTGGSENRDVVNDEVIENPTIQPQDFFLDYRFESRTFQDLTATGRNLNLRSPWNFDTNNGGFTSGIGAVSTENLGVGVVVAQWGEDKNFNNVLDAGEDRDPQNSLLDQNWGVDGGCGWQTNPTGVEGDPGGVWHTGRIDVDSLNNCLVDGNITGRCQTYEIIPGDTGTRSWFELLLTPEVEQVNDGLQLQHINWGWNMALQLADGFAQFTWEFDTDTLDAEVDLIADDTVFNGATGPFGTIGAGGNDGLSRPLGFGQAAGGAYPVFAPFAPNGSTSNGTAGRNRVGQNSCYFEDNNPQGCGDDRTSPCGAFPPDDDIDNNGSGGIDEFVEFNGPLRNFDITTFNGPDMRFSTLEDIFGDSGATFRGALGLFIAEDNDATVEPNPVTDYGIAVDDMYMEWKEIRLDPDSTDCAAGECASLDLDVTNFFEGSAVLEITGIDKTPTCATRDCDQPATAVNDCDFDGIADGTTDCDGDGVRDIVVEVFNDNRQDVEIVFLNAIATGSPIYKGSVSISANFDTDPLAPWNPASPQDYEPGALFVQRNGTDLPAVNAEYFDNDIDGGTAGAQICDNDSDTAAQGLIEAGTNVFFPVGTLTVKAIRVDDLNGDLDGIADPNETVDLYVTLNNNSGQDLTNVVARLTTNDAKISCITIPVISVGNLADGAVAETTGAFTFQVAADAQRTGAFDDWAADLTISLSSGEFDATIAPQTVSVDIDLDITPGGGAPTTFFEDFEGGAFGQFTSMSLDVAAKGSNAASDGYRCQYNNPDFINANSYGSTTCYLGAGLPFLPETTFDWHNHDQTNPLSSPDGGRAFSGIRSLHMGSHDGNPDNDTTTFGQLDAIRTTNAINLGSGNPELTFKHQASLIDNRTVNVGQLETPDKGVVMVQVANNSGAGTGSWVKIRPYSNVYDVQGTDNYFECMFDPIDDGNDEDDFFDPTDPDRRLGPSSTCYPEFVFAFLGDTDYRNTANADAIGRASEGPGLTGSIDRGTWVESKVDLARYAGRRIFLRFLYTSIQVQPGVDTIEQLFDLPSGWPGDDGWYIDDVRVEGALTVGNTVAVDINDNSGLPDQCLTNCTTLTANLTADVNPTAAPGHLTTLDASGSSADQCTDGVLQFRFWLDVNNNSVVEPGTDTLLRDWTDNAFYEAAPGASGNYAVDARCSSAPECGAGDAATAFLFVTVNCPSTGTAGFSQTVLADTKTQYSWTAAATVDVIRGNLDGAGSGAGAASLLGTGSFNGSVENCLQDDQNIVSFTDATAPLGTGDALYYLVRGAGATSACNAVNSYNSGGSGQAGDRDAGINADANACP